MPGPNVALDAYNEEVLANQQQQGNKQSLELNALQLAQLQQDQQAETQLGQYGQGLMNPSQSANPPSAVSTAQQPQTQPAQTFPLGTNPGNGTAIDYSQQPGGDTGQQPTSGMTSPPVGSKPNMSAADYNNALAVKAAQLGRPNLANKYWQQAGAAQEGAIKMAQAQDALQMGNLKRISETGQLISQYLGSAHTPEEWDNGINMLAANGVPAYEIQALKKMPFNPATAQALGAHATTAYQNAELQLRQLQIQQEGNQRAATLAETIRRDQQTEQWRKQQLAYKERNQKQGTPITAPSKNDLATATSAIKETLYNGEDVPDEDKNMVDTLTQDVASRAKQLVRANRGMDMSTAANHAIAELQQSGQLTKNTTPPGPIGKLFGQEGTTSNKFTPKGNSPQDALKDPGDPGQRVVGKYYSVNGQVRQWLGTGQ